MIIPTGFDRIQSYIAGERETIFAVHDADGQQIALVADRNLAFMLARQHDKVPMTVH